MTITNLSRSYRKPTMRLRTSEALDGRIGEIRKLVGEDISPYALDPLAALRDGLLKVLDLETLTTRPFRAWPHQMDVVSSWVDIEHLQRHGRPRFRNLHEEKSRQMGLSWITAYVAWWVLNFHAVPGLALSRKLGEVCDSGFTTDSFFGRIRFLHESAPPMLRAPLLFVGGNDPSIRNPLRPNAYLAGEGASLDPGRGGKYGYVFLDEAARIPWGRSVHASVTRACPVGRFYNSTPRGEDDLYFWLRDKRPAGYTFLRHHWTAHPVYARGLHVAATAEGPSLQDTDEMCEVADGCDLCEGVMSGLHWSPSNVTAHRYPGRYTSPWYETAVVEMTNEQVSEELDIDYAGSLTGRVYPEFSEELHVVDDIRPEYGTRTCLSFDYGIDLTAVGVWQESPHELRMLAEVELSGVPPEDIIARVKQEMRAAGFKPVDLSPSITSTYLAVGDPAGEARQMSTGRPLVSDYRGLGFNIVSRPQTVARTIVAVKRLLMGRPKRLVISRRGCPEMIRHLKMNRWPVDASGNRRLNATAPHNDLHNHAPRAASYLVTWLWPPPQVEEALLAARIHTDIGHPGVDVSLPRSELHT